MSTTTLKSKGQITLVERTLRSYARGKGDFSDYLLGEIGEARSARTTFTFDRKLRGRGGFTLL
jgi:predicted nucleic-acid-binding protein